MEENLSVPEIQFKKVMGIMAAIFFVALIFFTFIPEGMIQTANWVGYKVLKLDKAPVPYKVPAEVEWPLLYDGASKPQDLTEPLVMGRGYVALACSLMVLCIAIAGMCYFNPRRYIEYVPLLLLAKFSSSAFGLYFYLRGPLHMKYFGNLAITIADFPVFLVILFVWWRARKSPVATPQVKTPAS